MWDSRSVRASINLCLVGDADEPEAAWERVEDTGLCENNHLNVIEEVLHEGAEAQPPKCLPCLVAPSWK